MLWISFQREAEAVLDSEEDQQCVVVGNISLYGRDLHTLKDEGLLNDKVVCMVGQKCYPFLLHRKFALTCFNSLCCLSDYQLILFPFIQERLKANYEHGHLFHA